MGKLKRVLTLINLLTHRQYVALDTIVKACGIPERTAYRYLRDISEANFPIYFDKNVHAYRLDQPTGKRKDEYSAEESVLLIVGLKLFASALNNDYRADVEALIKKVLVRQSLPLEEIVDAYNYQLDNLNIPLDCSALVSSMFLSTAIRSGKRVRVKTGSGRGREKEVRFDNPALVFKGNWQLKDARGTSGESTEVPKIKKVSIINQ